MRLTDDQKAMLRLLAQREQGYGDIAALTGQGVDEVRAKVGAAVAALDSSAPPAEDQRAILRLLAQREEGYADIAALTGQSVEQVRGKVAVALEELGGSSQPQQQPVPEPQAEADAEAEPAAKATPAPALAPAAKPVAPKAPPKPKAGPATKTRRKLPEDKGAVWGLGAGLAVILVLVILLATGALGGGDSTDSGSSSSSSTNDQASNAAKLKPTQAVLKAVDGSDARGRALFGKDGKKVILVVEATGLRPSPSGRSYTVSLAKAPGERLPLIATRVPDSGKLVSSFQIAPQVLGLLASGWDTLEVSLVANGELGAALRAARTAKKAPRYQGEDVLSGPVTGAIVEAGEEGEVKP